MAAVAVVVALIWGAVAYQLDRERDARLRLATQHSQNLAGVVAGHFSAYVESVDVLLRRLRAEWVRDRGGFAEAVSLVKELRKDAFPARLVVIDSRGRVAYAMPRQETGSASDAEYLAAHRGKSADELRIGNPEKDHASGKLSVRFTRPILD